MVHCAIKMNSSRFFSCAQVSSKQQSIMKQLEFNFKAMRQAWCQVELHQQIHQGILKKLDSRAQSASFPTIPHR